MKILITGTAGFIGFHLAEKMLALGHNVVGIDSINSYYDPELKYGRLAASGIQRSHVAYNVKVQSQTHANYTFYQMLLEDEAAMAALFSTEQFDVVVNLAAQAGVRYSLENPHAYIQANVTGFLNILEQSRLHKIKHLVYASSSSVYGLNTDPIFRADQAADHPVSLYAATKRSNELMAHVYSNLYQLPVTGLRFFTVYGPWGRPDMAPMLFSKAITEGKPISVFNNGDLQRDFTYVGDIVDGIIKVTEQHPPAGKPEEYQQNQLPNNSPAPFAIYNIGNSQPVKLMDFISLIEQELGVEAKKNFMPMQPGDVYSTYADVTPLSEFIGYKPSTPLSAGIKEFIKWYRDFYKV